MFMAEERLRSAVPFILVAFMIAIPAWLPVLWTRQRWAKLKGSTVLLVALILFTVSELLQLIFVICVGTGLFTLDHSLAFAGVALPSCILAVVVAVVGLERSARSGGVIISSFLSFAAWAFLIMLH
jgi:hypothetical protein